MERPKKKKKTAELVDEQAEDDEAIDICEDGRDEEEEKVPLATDESADSSKGEGDTPRSAKEEELVEEPTLQQFESLAFSGSDPADLKRQAITDAKEAARKERAERIAAVTNRLTQPRRPIAPSILKKHTEAAGNSAFASTGNQAN